MGVEPPSPESQGRVLAGRYRLDHLMAVGGTAEVWRGHDELLDRSVAVKVLHRHLTEDAELTRRFRAEAIAAGRLHDPGIVRVFDTCTDGGDQAIVMELVTGGTLRQELDEGPTSVARALEVVRSVAAALTTAHRAGVVHRDIKPANILLGDGGRLLVTDFGVAKLADGDRTSEGLMLGSAKYLSPEQVRGDPVDGRADQFALAVVALECLLGRAPWVADTPMATALARLHEPPPTVSTQRADCSQELDRVLHRALAVDPEERFADLPAFVGALETSVVPGAGSGSPAAGQDPDATAIAPRPPAPPVAPPAATPPDVPRPAASPPPPAPIATPAPPPAAPSRSTRSRSRGPRLAVAALVLTAVAVVGALLLGTGTGRELTERATQAVVASEDLSATVTAYDPQGTGPPGENDELAPLANDGDPDTAWRTEGYEARDMGAKDGVGLVATLGAPAELDEVVIASPTTGWAAEVYVADGPAASLAGWGEPVATESGLAGDATFDLAGRSGGAVLVWFTDLGDGPPRVRLEVSDLTVRGRP